MITSENVLYTPIILTVLISATVISYTSKFFLVPEKLKKPIDQTYESEVDPNCTRICVFSKNAHSTKYEMSPCFNKTLLEWYNPWLRHYLWFRFWTEKKAKAQMNLTAESPTKAENATEAPTPDTVPTTAPTEAKKEVEVQKVKEKPVEFVYSVLIGLLVVSGVVACWEVLKERLKKNEIAAAKAQARQCTLADFTINRHLRRESQQQTGSHLPRQASLELAAKVTQTLTHQSSLDRAFPKNTSEALMPLESRRNSMPLYLADIQQSAGKTKPGKRQSVDVAAEDMSSETKRKSRHFIRRH